MKKTSILVAVMLLAGGLGSARAERLMSDQKALKEMLPGAASIEKVVKPVTAAELSAIKKELGGKLYADGKPGITPKEFTFYFGMKDGKKTGVAMMQHEPGKWGVVGFSVGMTADTGKIVNMAVVTMSEKRGRPIALKNFLKQFFGLDKNSPFEVGKDINAVSGATMSTHAAVFAARKSVLIYDFVYLKK